MTQETLKVPRITTSGLLGDEFLEVLQVGTTETWITPYKRYLADELCTVRSLDVDQGKHGGTPREESIRKYYRTRRS